MRRTDLQQSRTISIDNLPSSVRPSDGDIATRAYDRYLARGRADGHDIDDWLAAEQELANERREQLATA
jgi:hypothetical protein